MPRRNRPRDQRTPWWLALLLTLSSAWAAPVPDALALTDLDGRSSAIRLAPTNQAVVYVFLGVECPIANRALPELVALEKRFAPRGIRFFHLYPNADESPDRIREHRRHYGLGAEAYRDPGLRIAAALRACRTPEVVALTREGRLIYQGRINDQFTALGVGRPQPTRHDLAEALEGFLSGKAPAAVVTPGVGCTFRTPP